MKISLSSDPIQSLAADALVVGVFEDEPPLDGPLGAVLEPRLKSLREGKDFEGKPKELLILHEVEGIKSRRVALVGLGKSASVTPMSLGQSIGTAFRSLASKKRSRIAIALPGPRTGTLDPARQASSSLIGAIVAVVGQDLYRKEKSRHQPEEIVLLPARVEDRAAVEQGAQRGQIVGEAVNWARRMVNLPPADLSPEGFVEQARKDGVAAGLKVESLDQDRLAELNMNGILGVAMGSARPPRLLIARYSGGKKDDPTYAWVGKGVVFDSGGLSLKTADGMTDMKCDMAGAATVFASAIAAARLQLPINLLVLCPLVENMPSGAALRPGDVLTTRSGKTIEVLNTDAEGRLILSDALHHAVELGASKIIDLATLTGSCMVALGMTVGGVMTNRDEFADDVLAAAQRAGERAWPLPMFDDYDELIKSQVADMKNTAGRWGGAITAAKLLAQFVGDVPWVHVDIAGPAWAEKDKPHQDGGGTGYFVRTLIEWAESQS